MSTPFETSSARTPPVSAPVARSVAEDLEAIFPHEPRPPTTALRLRGRRRRDRRPGGERSSAGRLGAMGTLAAAALVGVSTGALLERAPARPSPVQGATPSLPSPGPLPVGQMHAPPPRVLIAAPQPAAAAPAKVRKTSARRSPARRRHAAVARHTPSLMQADAHLRSAYASARRAGVSSTVLSDYRDRWDALRLRAPREPRLVSARYDAMAEDLNRMAARHAVERESRPGPWRALRTQIAALWR